MRHILLIPACFCLPLAALAVATAARAQAPTAAEFYLQYRQAFDAAQKIDEVLPFMAAAMRKEIEATPSAERPQLFEMIKMMNTLTSVRIRKETATAAGATLVVDALDADKAKIAGTVEIVKENGAWKVAKENWSSR
jgi:hypothetical protein